MKPRLALLLVSIAANVALAVAISRRPTTPAADALNGVTPDSAAAALFPKRMKATGPAAEVLIKKVAIRWSQLESDNYVDFIKRLRAFGVPEKTIQDIIVADVHKLYRPKIAALRPPPLIAKTNFWMERRWGRWGDSVLHTTKEQREQIAALQLEERELVKTLLGRDVYIKIAQDVGQKSRLFFGTIPEDMQDAVEETQRRYAEEMDALQNPPDNFYSTDAIAALKTLRQERLDALGKLMTPEQLKDFEAQNSDDAYEMRYSLGFMDPSESEFRSLLASKKEFSDFEASLVAANEGLPWTPEMQQADQQKTKELKDAIIQTLGTQRYREYIASSSFTYQGLLESGASMETVIKVADVKKEVENATKTIQDNKSLTDEQRRQTFLEMKQETMNKLTELLGERRANAYPRSGGNWVQRIVPPEE